MSVLIGHASISEQSTVNGTKGDSTSKEVCTRTWYSKPWGYMAIHPDANVREKHAKAIEQSCANNNIGYGQNDRNTLYTQAEKMNYDLSKITTKCNCDCSSLQNVAAMASGASGVTYGSNGWTTSNMKAYLQKAGYKIVEDGTYLKSADYCVRGAIYVKAGSHTVTGLSNDSKYKQTLSKAGIGSISSSSSYSTGGSTTIKNAQKAINSFCKAGLTVDGIMGANTRKGIVKALQTALNKDYKSGLSVDGIRSTKTNSALGNHYVKRGETQYLVTFVEIALAALGCYSGSIEMPGVFGSGLETAVYNFQKATGLSADKIAGRNTILKMLTNTILKMLTKLGC